MQQGGFGLTKRSSTEIDRIVGEKLHEIRKRRGLSLQSIATRMGISYQQLQKYEAGSDRISVSRLYDAAAILEVPLSVFFKELCPQGQSLDATASLYLIQDSEIRAALSVLIDRLADHSPRVGSGALRGCTAGTTTPVAVGSTQTSIDTPSEARHERVSALPKPTCEQLTYVGSKPRNP